MVRRLDQLVALDRGGSQLDERGPRRATTPSTCSRARSAIGPRPAVVERLDALYLDRQQRVSRALRRPVAAGETARRALGDLLLAHGEEMQRAGRQHGGVYLRAGLISRGGRAHGQPRGRRRATIPSCARCSTPAAKPTAERRRTSSPWRGVSSRASICWAAPRTDAPDSVRIAPRVLEAGLARTPATPSCWCSASHRAAAARRTSSRSGTWKRRDACWRRRRPPASCRARVSAELIELYFLRLRLRLDPERDAPAFAEADASCAAFAETRQRFASTEHEGARRGHRLRAGAAATSTPGRSTAPSRSSCAARDEGEPIAEVTIELAEPGAQARRSAARQPDPARRARRAARAQSPTRDTIGSVEGRARLERLLGDAYDAAGDRGRRRGVVAQRPHRLGAPDDRAPAAQEPRRVGRGRPSRWGGCSICSAGTPKALQKFDEAIEADGDRDQTYIDAIAFLVQHGEIDAALSVHHRALSRPGRAVSEYVKVYTSLWVLDLSRRTNKVADTKAERYLRTLDRRHGDLRPRRGAAWYRQLAKFAVGQLSYEQMLAAADTTGKRAEIYFYEGMRRLGDGKSDDAHQLWQKVIETRMFSFFEFDMASRYLRVAPPPRPRRPRRRRSFPASPRAALRAENAVCILPADLVSTAAAHQRSGPASPDLPLHRFVVRRADHPPATAPPWRNPRAGRATGDLPRRRAGAPGPRRRSAPAPAPGPRDVAAEAAPCSAAAGTSRRSASRSVNGRPATSAQAAARALAIVEHPAPQRAQRRGHRHRAGVGAAHLDVALQADLREQRRQMDLPVAESRRLARPAFGRGSAGTVSASTE